MSYPGPAETTALPSTSNASIDRVVFQIEHLSGQINVLTNNVDGAVQQLTARGKDTVSNINNNFNKNNGTLENVDRLLDVVRSKTADWPLQALIVVGITLLILLIIAVLYYLTKGGQKLAERRYKKAIIPESDL